MKNALLLLTFIARLSSVAKADFSCTDRTNPDNQIYLDIGDRKNIVFATFSEIDHGEINDLLIGPNDYKYDRTSNTITYSGSADWIVLSALGF